MEKRKKITTQAFLQFCFRFCLSLSVSYVLSMTSERDIPETGWHIETKQGVWLVFVKKPNPVLHVHIALKI